MPAHQTIQRGSTGADVKAAQEELMARGYCVGPLCTAAEIDGLFGPHTFRAVVDYQDARSASSIYSWGFNMPLKVDGIVGIQTWARLDPDTIKLGAKGALVSLLQNILIALGYNPGGVDGDFGTNTDLAVKAFQGANGLTANGVVDKANWRLLWS
jgi:peptidoglycan hydrolase-like protein with peptidoglycan-binding domain